MNAAVFAELGADAERLGGLDRVTAERHGAIRLGTPAELAQAARIFAALGMSPVGFYDLRDAAAPIPVVSTAFRPTTPTELERNPFRVFTSLLAVDDSRFFDAELRAELRRFLSQRRLFSPDLLVLADHAAADGGLADDDAETFLSLASASFALSTEPVNRVWYERLARISSVAADIGGVGSTHINHLTPRVLDIDRLYSEMVAEGIEMIDEIQGPPRWKGPDLLLRQTSFKALAEQRTFAEPDGSLSRGQLRVRFGEVEARGIALTPSGRDIYDRCIDADDPAAAFDREFPATEAEFAADDLAFFTFDAIHDRRDAAQGKPPNDLANLIADGWVTASPQVYEDFLPRSAAGIFASNLTGGSVDLPGDTDATAAPHYDADWLAGALQAPLLDPMDLYAAHRDASLEHVASEFGLGPLQVG